MEINYDSICAFIHVVPLAKTLIVLKPSLVCIFVFCKVFGQMPRWKQFQQLQEV